MLVAFIYRVSNALTEWYDLFETELSLALNSTHSHTIILGDFNIDLMCEDNKRWPLLFKSYGLSQVISEPTRVTSNTATLLDHILVSDSQNVQESCCASMIIISDHYPVGIPWKIRNRWSEGYHKVMEYRKIRQINSEVFSLNIEKIT